MPIVDVEILRQIPMFELLDERELEVLAGQLEIEHYVANQIIFTAGEEGGEMYLVQRGRVEVFVRDVSHARVTIDHLEVGEIFGDLSLLDNQPRSASAKALADSTLIVIDRDDLLALVRTHPAAALDIMAMLGKRLRATDTLVKSRVTARDINAEIEYVENKLNLGERLADLLTMVSGDIRFVYFNFALFFVWIVVNLNLIPGVAAFDPFPFGLLTMIVSLEAIFLSLFVLMSQNRQAERDRVRNDIEYQVNLRAELEIRELHDRLDDLEGMIARSMPRREVRRANPREVE